MAKLDDVIAQIQSQLPKYTDDFNDANTIKSVSVSAGVMTVELDVAQTIQDEYINVRDVYARIDIVGSASAGEEADTWIIQTEIDHDQTLSDVQKQIGVEKYITIKGTINEDVLLVDVPANDLLTIERSVAPSGSNYIVEDRGYNGRKEVTWISNKIFTYETGQEIEAIAPSGTIQSNIRIDGIANESEIIDYLENETIDLDKNTIYVLMQDARASKNLFARSDAFNRKEFKDDLKLEINQNFSLYVVIPTQDDITPRKAVNYIYDLRPLIIKSLHGVFFDSNFSDGGKFLCSYYADGGEQYNKSYYVHRFEFETVFNIENEDAVPIEDTRAFRSFELGYRLSYDDYENIKKTIQGTIE